MHRALPIVSLRLHSPTQHLTLGTLSTDRADFGRDRTTPHGLLPPLATETLWFTRAYEAGVQWQVRTPKVAHEVWYNYQKLNTPEHREKFDVGITGRLPISGPATAAYQIHLVHHGGELYAGELLHDSRDLNADPSVGWLVDQDQVELVRGRDVSLGEYAE